MTEQSYDLEFKGYWPEENRWSIPAISGIYCVYECTFDPQSKFVSLNELIYIGGADDVNSRIATHEKYPFWKKHVLPGNELYFSCALLNAKYRDQCEAAMIFEHKPPENHEHHRSFPFDRTIVSLSGKTELLHTHFTVEKSA
ncbi:MAG: GIY-YIG nuclease family protein [Dehalococcoidia bacterium]|nr:GIY-YIG nuclease family protein [Dehalococcoidia bacterium]